MGNPFVHIELNTGDLAKARKFYGALFDWKLTDMPMGSGGAYTMLDVGQGTGGGMQTNPMPGAPAAWISYVQVDDVDKTVASARKLGGQILEPKIEVPNMGWIALLADPTGAVLGLWQPMKKAAPPPPPPPPAAKAPAPKPAAKKPAAPARKPAAPARKPAAPAKKPAAKSKPKNKAKKK